MNDDYSDLIARLHRIAKISYGATIEEGREVSKTQREAADTIERLCNDVAFERDLRASFALECKEARIEIAKKDDRIAALESQLAAENDYLRRRLRPFAQLASSPLSWAMVEYCIDGDPEKQTLQAPQMQRAFNRAADALHENVPSHEPADCEALDLPDWIKNAKPPAPAQAEHQGENPPFSNCSFRTCDLPGQCRGEGKCHHPRGKYKQQANCTCGGGSGHTRSCPKFDESMMRYEPFGKAAEQQGDGGADPRILAGRWRSDFVNKCGHPPDAEDGYAAGYRDAQPSACAALSDEQKQRVYDAVRQALGDAYDCTRVWHAWGVGTMSQDDFRLVAEDDDRIAEIADAAILAANAAQERKS